MMTILIIVILLIALAIWMRRFSKKSQALMDRVKRYAVQHGKLPADEVEQMFMHDGFIQWFSKSMKKEGNQKLNDDTVVEIYGKKLIEYYYEQYNPHLAKHNKIPDPFSQRGQSEVSTVQMNSSSIAPFGTEQPFISNPTEKLSDPFPQEGKQYYQDIDINAERELLLIVLHRIGTPRFAKEEAIKQLTTFALEYSDLQSAQYLGDFYQTGKYVDQDSEKAKSFYEWVEKLKQK